MSCHVPVVKAPPPMAQNPKAKTKTAATTTNTAGGMTTNMNSQAGTMKSAIKPIDRATELFKLKTAISKAIHDVYNAALSYEVGNHDETDNDTETRATKPAETETNTKTTKTAAATRQEKALAYESARHGVRVLNRFCLVMHALRQARGRREIGDLLATHVVTWYRTWEGFSKIVEFNGKPGENGMPVKLTDAERTAELVSIFNEGAAGDNCIRLAKKQLNESSRPEHKTMFWFPPIRKALRECCSLPVPLENPEYNYEHSVLQTFTSPQVLQTWSKVMQELLPIFARFCATTDQTYSPYQLALDKQISDAQDVLKSLDRGVFVEPDNSKQKTKRRWWRKSKNTDERSSNDGHVTSYIDVSSYTVGC